MVDAGILVPLSKKRLFLNSHGYLTIHISLGGLPAYHHDQMFNEVEILVFQSYYTMMI
jgi:hypothetical protein